MIFSEQFQDIYFNPEKGKEESDYVFFQPNRVEARLQDGFTLTEMGFGTGLNFFVLLEKIGNLTKKSNQKIKYYSVEKYPLEGEVIRAVVHRYFATSEILEALESFIVFWQEKQAGWNRYEVKMNAEVGVNVGEVELNLFIGDVENFLLEIEEKKIYTDVWFLDGFAPSKNPSMWSDELFAVMGKWSRKNDPATFSTFSVAGKVRRGLQRYFDVERVKGFEIKREMLVGKHKLITN